MNPLPPVGDIGPTADLDIRSLANSMAAGVWVIDAHGSLVGVNSAEGSTFFVRLPLSGAA